MDHHLTELIDVAKCAFGENWMNQTSGSEIEPSRRVSSTFVLRPCTHRGHHLRLLYIFQSARHTADNI
jgi:hypothetical protein